MDLSQIIISILALIAAKWLLPVSLLNMDSLFERVIWSSLTENLSIWTNRIKV